MEIDCSLLEISGEDDSLLQNQSGEVSFFNASSSFSCSPLLHRSDSLLTPIGKGNEMVENRSLNQSSGKENRSICQPKLGMEGQQMKRKKKGGGYNLRKSLAWNRAFFTEEGFLSSSELSLISGNFGNSTGETLSVIHEDGEPELGAMDSDSVGLQALEENLFKELPVNNPSIVISKHKQSVQSPLGKSRSSSKSKLSRCPRPALSSALKRPVNVKSTSLKRPANANITKGTTKESKLSKAPVSKVDPSVVCTSAKNVDGASKLRRDEITKSDKIQKTIRSAGHSIERKEVPKKAESSSASRSLIPKFSSQQARRNTGSSTSKTQSSAGVRNLEVNKTDGCIKARSRQDHATVDCATNGHDVVPTKNDSLPQNSGNVIGNRQQVQQQIAKPSGLRMPSPSLGFFSQLKTSATHNFSQDRKRNSGSQSSIPNVSKFGASKPIGATENFTAGESSAIKSVPSTVSANVHENMGATNQASKLMVDVKGPLHANNKIYETTNTEQQFERIHGDAEQQMNDLKLPNKLVYQSGLFGEMKEENDINANHIDPESQNARNPEFQSSHFMLISRPQTEGYYISRTDDVTDSQVAADNEPSLTTENASLLKELQLDNENNSSMCGSSKACDDLVNMMNDVKSGKADRSPCSVSKVQIVNHVTSNQVVADREHNILNQNANLLKELQLHNENGSGLRGSSKACDDFVNMMNDVNREKAERLSTCSVSNHQTIDNCQRQCNSSLGMQTERFRDLKSDNSVEYELTSSEAGCNSEGLESFYCSTHSIDGKPEKDSASEGNDMSRKFMDGTECMHSFGVTVPFACRERFSDTAKFGGQHLVHDATNEKFTENPVVSDSRQVAPRDFQDQNESQLTDFFLHGEIVSSEELVGGDSDEFAPEGKADSCDCKLEDSTLTSKVPLARQHQIADLGYVHLQAEHDADLVEAGSNELEEIEEVQVAAPANTIDNNNDSQLHGDLPKSEWESLLSADYASPPVQAKVDSIIVDKIDPTLMEKIESEGFVDNHCTVSASGLEENISCQQGHQVSMKDAFVDNAASGSPNSNRSDDKKDTYLDAKNKVSDHTACFSYDFTALRVEHNLGTVSSHNSITIYPLNEDTGLVGEDADRSAISNGSDSLSREEQNLGPVVTCNSMTVCSSKGDSGLEIEADQANLCEDLLQCKGVTMPDSKPSVKEADIVISGDEIMLEIKTALQPVENEDLALRKSGNDKVQAPLTIKPPPNAVPFSDEWLAAFEAAGEEILAKKGGAVQNSPPEKSLPEPGPWSPVKRKGNQEIGPFDCTKYTNTTALAPGSNER